MAEMGEWKADPTGRHEHRYFDGQEFTDHVADQGVRSVDPLSAQEGDMPLRAPAATPVHGPMYVVQMYGAENRTYSLADLQGMALAKVIRPETMVQRTGAPYAIPAAQVPGVFSDKTWVTALLLSLFLGCFGVDRFYLGHSGVGVAKLLTLGGCGVWALIDMIMIATRSVLDSNGRPLS